ncbi:MAG: DUF6883 domain-containing protein, partial [Stellaceae bacterium]
MVSRLPGAPLALIEERKITGYLLASGHPAGRTKAAFFKRFGFCAVEWEQLRDALPGPARSARVISRADTEFGRKYLLEGPLTAPDSRKPRVRTVWFVAIGETAPRLVTAYAA